MSDSTPTTTTEASNEALAAQLRALGEEYPERWFPAEEAHTYNDGTSHFTHVHYVRKRGVSHATISIAHYVTPELAELLCLLHNNLDRITAALIEPNK